MFEKCERSNYVVIIMLLSRFYIYRFTFKIKVVSFLF